MSWLATSEAEVQNQGKGVCLSFNPERFLTCEKLESAACELETRFELSEDALYAMKRACEALSALESKNTPIYGITTGFGPFVGESACSNGSIQASNLLAHLGAGSGAFAPVKVVRGAMIARVNNLIQGYSGVEPGSVRAYLDLLECGITPAVPAVGSVGASGDLIPLAHVARVLSGEGKAFYRDGLMDAGEALRQAGLSPLTLSSRDALGLVNGTSFMASYASFAVARAERLIKRAEGLTGWLYRQIGARKSALDSRLHEARGHWGQIESARSIAEEAFSGGVYEDGGGRPLQEVYSVRCAPQVLGACRENLRFARRLIETELNGASDNPLFVGEGSQGFEVLHGGNFQGQQVAFASDALNAALVQAGVLAERQLDALLGLRLWQDAPLLLAWQPGENSGLAGAQVTATALVAEMRAHAQAHGTFSIPTNGNNQDVVSMGTMAARMTYEQTTRLASILAILGLALNRLTFLRAHGRAGGAVSPTPDWMPSVEETAQDRAYFEEIERVAEGWLKASD